MKNEIVKKLSAKEQKLKDQIESRIEYGIGTFYDVGKALAEINAKRLYRNEYTTFAEYCQKKWNMTPQRAGQLRLAYETVEEIKSNSKIETVVSIPKTEGEARKVRKQLHPPAKRKALPEVTVESTPVVTADDYATIAVIADLQRSEALAPLPPAEPLPPLAAEPPVVREDPAAIKVIASLTKQVEFERSRAAAAEKDLSDATEDHEEEVAKLQAQLKALESKAPAGNNGTYGPLLPKDYRAAVMALEARVPDTATVVEREKLGNELLAAATRQTSWATRNRVAFAYGR